MGLNLGNWKNEVDVYSSGDGYRRRESIALLSDILNLRLLLGTRVEMANRQLKFQRNTGVRYIDAVVIHIHMQM